MARTGISVGQGSSRYYTPFSRKGKPRIRPFPEKSSAKIGEKHFYFQRLAVYYLLLNEFRSRRCKDKGAERKLFF